MLITNQQLDKLTAMRSDFSARGMLSSAPTASTTSVSHTQHLGFQNMPADNDDDEEGPVEENVLGHVSLAWICSISLLSLGMQPVSDANPAKCPFIHKILRLFPPWLVNLTFNTWPRNALPTS